MKRGADMTEKEWQECLEGRKRLAEQRMAEHDKTFVGLGAIHAAALAWYGRAGLDECCLAENRLHNGEVPPTRKVRR